MIDSSDVPPISEAAALDVITKLAAEFERLDENERPRLVLVGGQAVLLWQKALAVDGDTESYLETTDDIDFVVRERETMENCARVLRGTLFVPEPDHHTPNLGVVAYKDLDGYQRRLDFLASPIGLDAEKVIARAVPAKFSSSSVTLYVLHPEDVLLGAVAKLLAIRSDEVTVRQVRSAIVSIREYARFLLDSKKVENRVRVVLQGNQRILLYAKRKPARELYLRYGIEVFDAVLEEHDELPAEFFSEFLPRAKQEIQELRARQLTHAEAAKSRLEDERLGL